MLGVLLTAALSATPALQRGLQEADHTPHAWEVRELFVPLMELLSHLSAEEFILVIITVIPVALGTVATLHVLTGVTKSELDAQEGGDVEAGDFSGVTAAVHKDIDDSTASVTASVSKVEKQIVDLQRAHDTRFADLHKDLAGIVWELSKLRADMARWQALAQLGSRSASKSSLSAQKPGGGSGSASAAAAAGGGAEEKPAASSEAAGATPTNGGEAAGGARAWRGED